MDTCGRDDEGGKERGRQDEEVICSKQQSFFLLTQWTISMQPPVSPALHPVPPCLLSLNQELPTNYGIILTECDYQQSDCVNRLDII